MVGRIHSPANLQGSQKSLLGAPELAGDPGKDVGVHGVEAVAFDGIELNGVGLLVVGGNMPPLRAVVVGFKTGNLLPIRVGDLGGIVRAKLEKAVAIAVAP